VYDQQKCARTAIRSRSTKSVRTAFATTNPETRTILAEHYYPEEYFIDVLSRVDDHPISRIDELTPARLDQVKERLSP